MSEEIIIDGVNVAGCCCYENSKCLWTKRYYENNIVPVCEKVKDCYYKQLNRLQAENEGLKSTNDFVVKQLERRVNQLREYRKALEEIREIAKIAFIVCDDECGNANKFAEIQDKINEVLK